MSYSEKLAGRIRSALGKHKGVAEKKMFGGLAFLLNGNMCCGVHGEDMIVRLDPNETDRALRDRHTRVFDLSGGRPMKGWILVGSRGLAKATDLRKWVRTSLTYAGSLASK